MSAWPDLPPYLPGFAEWLARRGIVNWCVVTRRTPRLVAEFDHLFTRKQYAALRWQHYHEEIA